ncbi:PLAT/LH2 domain-containing protein [Kitasatospora sp. NPDC094011]|uniref:PLAT/LH2 domain-containing protein n=1 Tax=Kitasatospora sp. NPDC094011 TaxID=3364090 RepID=UPI00380B587F
MASAKPATVGRLPTHLSTMRKDLSAMRAFVPWLAISLVLVSARCATAADTSPAHAFSSSCVRAVRAVTASQSTSSYTVAVKTGKVNYISTVPKLYMSIVGKCGTTREFPLKGKFEDSSVDTGTYPSDFTGELRGARIRLEISGQADYWRMVSVSIKNNATRKSLTIACDIELKEGQLSADLSSGNCPK